MIRRGDVIKNTSSAFWNSELEPGYYDIEVLWFNNRKVNEYYLPKKKMRTF